WASPFWRSSVAFLEVSAPRKATSSDTQCASGSSDARREPNPPPRVHFPHVALLQTHQLQKAFHDRMVVQGVSYSVDSAEIVGLLGRNGAGKTTSFRMTIGMIEADGGKVVFDTHDITDLPMFKRARLGMGYLSQ